MALSDKLEAKLDELTAYPRADEAEYTPRTEFDYATGGYIQTGPLREEPKNYDQLLVAFGYDPTEVAIVRHPRISRWQQRARIRGTADYQTTWLSAYKFQIAARASSVQLDLADIVKRARKAPKTGTGPHWMCLQISDTQIGKRAAGGGTEAICERFIQAVDTAKEEFKQLKRHGIEGIQISMPGDVCEGNQSQRGRNMGYNTDLVISEQVRVMRRLMMYAVETMAPLTDQLYFDCVGGNHDEADRQLNSWPGNNWATETAIAVDDALKLNPTAYGHVTVRIPDQYSGSMTVPVGDTVVTVVHGHQWRRNNAFKWWSEQSIGNQPAGAAHVLQHGHWHEWRVESNAERTVICSPTLDTGSDWYRETHGGTSRRGALVYLLHAGEVSRMSIV